MARLVKPPPLNSNLDSWVWKQWFQDLDLALASITGGTGAPTGSAYVTIGNDATLTAERSLTAGANITITDNGPNNTVVIASTGGGAATTEAFVTIGNTAGLSAERAITAGANITITDGGANSTVTIASASAGMAGTHFNWGLYIAGRGVWPGV